MIDHNHDKYITTQEFNKLTSENFATILAAKADIAGIVKKAHFDEKLTKLTKKLIQINKTCEG